MDTKICSKCGVKKPANEFYRKHSENRLSSWCKRCLYDMQMTRWKDRKKKAVSLMGGCCVYCGYNKNYAALDFHHKEADEKEFDWRKSRECSWDKVILELKKCVLLCKNCHAEHHNPDCAMGGDGLKDNALLNNIISSTGVCPTCQSDVYGTIYCCVECAKIARRKVKRPGKKRLARLIAEQSWCEIGRNYGVTDNAVRKWAKGYGLV